MLSFSLYSSVVVVVVFRRRASKKAEEGHLGHADPNEATVCLPFEMLRVAICAAREAGSAWSQQSCSKWCDKHALSPLAACAAAAMLTAVLARADSFTLASAGHTLELSDDRRCSKSRSSSFSRRALLEGQ